MNHQRYTAWLALSLAFGLVACQSTDKGAATGANITKAADQIERAIQELDVTTASLHAITENPASDLNAQRKTFEKALSSLESTVEDIRETAADMKSEGDAYFQQWDQQLASIQNEDIRERSADRREAIEASFSKLEDQYDETNNASEPLLNDLRDIRTALRADLTLSGIDALKPAVEDVDEKAESVGKELKELAQHFRDLGLDLSRSGPPKK